MMELPTITAISTPLGAGAIGIVRLTGPDAVDICDGVFTGSSLSSLAKATSHTLNHGAIVDPASGEPVDEVLVAVMRAPATYTCEDVVEVNCHGGAMVQQRILALFLEQGARLASPGEFTRRAFLNGRIDLAQAESVAQIIAARTEAGLKVAMAQLGGVLSREIRALRRQILRMLAAIEADIDFADEDIEELDRAEVQGSLAETRDAIGELIDTAIVGQVLSEGVRTAIIGKPNVGKSSLLNALLMRDRAIVTEVPGTTRDTIEEIINIGGIPLKLIDTAGLRPTGDEVEQIGVERSRQAIREAELVLCLLDGSEAEDDHDRALITSLDPEKTIYVINKADCFRGQPPRFNRALLPSTPVTISALTRQGLDGLKETIAERLLGGALPDLGSPIVTRERHRQQLAEAAASLSRAGQGLRVGLGEELIAVELRDAVQALGAITGEDLVEDLLDTIFQEFCIGK